MTDLPSDLNAWTYNTIKDLVTHHAHEPQHFDFKEQLNYEQARRDDMNRALVRTVCAMANSNTGFLIFGVRDTRRESGNSEDRICGIPIKRDYRRNFAEKIKGIQPEVHFEAASQLIPLPTDSSRGIFVVRIPLSPQRPHMDSGSGVFHTRGDGGNARHMSFYEVREQMMRTEALMQQVRLARLKLDQWEYVALGMQVRDAKSLRSCYGRFDTEAFDVLLSTICVALPADAELLNTLVKLSADAQILNRLVTRWQFNDYEGHRLQSDTEEAARWREEVRAAAEYVHLVCQECAEQFDELFGPLVGRHGEG